jgi:hypothetical protein
MMAFPRALVIADTELEAGNHVQQIRDIFQARGLKF